MKFWSYAPCPRWSEHQGLGQDKAGSQELHLSLWHGGGSPNTCAIFYYVSQGICRELDQKYSSWDTNQSPRGMRELQAGTFPASYPQLLLPTITEFRKCLNWRKYEGYSESWWKMYIMKKLFIHVKVLLQQNENLLFRFHFSTNYWSRLVCQVLVERKGRKKL